MSCRGLCETYSLRFSCCHQSRCCHTHPRDAYRSETMCDSFKATNRQHFAIEIIVMLEGDLRSGTFQQHTRVIVNDRRRNEQCQEATEAIEMHSTISPRRITRGCNSSSRSGGGHCSLQLHHHHSCLSKRVQLSQHLSVPHFVG